MDFFKDLKRVHVSITIENHKGLTLSQNFPDVHKLAEFLREHAEVAKKVGYEQKQNTYKRR